MTKVNVVVLCGRERDHWVNPSLWLASLSWSQDPDFECSFTRAYDYRTSQEARNFAVEQTLEMGFDWLLMVDNDVRCDLSGQMLNLLDLCAFPGRKVVAAAVPVIQNGVDMINAYFLQDPGDEMSLYRTVTYREFQEALDNRAGLLNPDAVGTGAIAIHRDVLLAVKNSVWLPERIQEYLPAPVSPFPVFLRPRHTDGRTFLGEDLLFSARARHCGFPPATSLHHLCGHYHTHCERDIPEYVVGNKPLPVAEDFGLKDPIPPVTPYSITPEIAQYLRESAARCTAVLGRPPRVLECGSGISTMVLASLTVKPKPLLALEEDREAAGAMQKFCVSGVRVIWAPVINGWYKFYWEDYREVGTTLMERWVDFLFIDGPRGDQPKARQPAIPALKSLNLLASGCVVVMDDADRPDERAAIASWGSAFNITDLVYVKVGRRTLCEFRIY